jgi:excisionase family DNA binding protein
MLTTLTAAAIAGVTPEAIEKAIQRGQLRPSARFGRMHVIERAELERWMRERRRPGRPRKDRRSK